MNNKGNGNPSPLDLTKELRDIKTRLESLEIRILRLNQNKDDFDPRLLGERDGVRY